MYVSGRSSGGVCLYPRVNRILAVVVSSKISLDVLYHFALTQGEGVQFFISIRSPTGALRTSTAARRKRECVAAGARSTHSAAREHMDL